MRTDTTDLKATSGAAHAMKTSRTAPCSAQRRPARTGAWQWPAAVVVLGLLATPVGRVEAASVQVEAGRSYMGGIGTWAVFAESVFDERPIGNSPLAWSPDVSVGWIDGRPLNRSGGYGNDAIWLVAGGIRFRMENRDGGYYPLFFSFQPALHTGRTAALSSSLEFVSTLGWQGERFSFQVRHISNGSLKEPNRGETMALIGVKLGL
ncbi:MAG: acyloxyacyl hydrolase [Lysobacter sp.]